MPNELQEQRTGAPTEMVTAPPPIVLDGAASMLARQTDPSLHQVPDPHGELATALGDSRRRMDWVRAGDLAPHLGKQAGEKVKELHETYRRGNTDGPLVTLAEQVIPGDRNSARNPGDPTRAAAGSPVSRRGTDRASAPSLPPIAAFGKPTTLQTSPNLSR